MLVDNFRCQGSAVGGRDGNADISVFLPGKGDGVRVHPQASTESGVAIETFKLFALFVHVGSPRPVRLPAGEPGHTTRLSLLAPARVIHCGGCNCACSTFRSPAFSSARLIGAGSPIGKPSGAPIWPGICTTAGGVRENGRE